MDDLLIEFLTETAESIDVVDVEIVKLEQDPNNKAVLDNIFRLVHTIKGTCGFLGLPRLEAVAHSAENVLGKFRDGKLEVNAEAVTLILNSLDRIKEILAGLEATQQEPEGDDSALIAHLDAVAAGKAMPVKAPEEGDPMAATEAMLGRKLKAGEVPLDELEAAFAAAPGPESREEEAREDSPPAREAHKPAPVSTPTAAKQASDAQTESQRSTQSIRVNVDLLEHLMNLVSELVLTRNQLLQMVRRMEDSEFAVPLQRLSQCTTELQEGVMKTRMQPIGNAWSKLPRIIRDLSVELGKKIDIEMRGADTELDRQVLELIKDPLTHMVRNSADHGIEMPADRVKAGKPETGAVRLNAYHEGGHIIIVISDDGRGIDTERLKAKALENGLASEAELETMTESQIQKFIFHAGLSTAQQVTAVSGRGVGMDVVRSNIEKIGGTIDLVSQQGKGTTFYIKIPLTLAIVSALIVQASTERFAIPQISVLELVRASDQSEHTIEQINDTPVLRLRNRLLPLIYLRDILGFERDKSASGDDFIVVTQVGAFTFGIVVDQVFDTEEIVVKPVAPILKDLAVYSGNTILGDGSVIMILDPNGIANAVTNAMQDSEQIDDAGVQARLSEGERESMLLFRAGKGGPKAVPLSLVARLEEVEVAAIEYADEQPMVQYRGALMPLVTVSPSMTLRSEGRQPVLVFADGDRSMGLAVDEILDIVEDELQIQLNTETNGLIGTAVVNGKVTEIIDVAHYLKFAFRDWLDGKKRMGKKVKGGAQRRILLIDDSSFFRNMLKPLLMATGYQVTTAPDAEAALKLREEGQKFDLIVSDIEMPGLSGFEFAEMVKGGGVWAETPLIALSALNTDKDFERGRKAGFNDYVAKMDREALLAALADQLAIHENAA
ncbi:MAG: chemotaxis protein CheW [Pseudomonadota bacterium]